MDLIEIFRAIKQNDLTIVKQLASRNSQKLNDYLYGVTPFLYSIECKNEDIALELLQVSTVNPLLKSNVGTTSLEKAIFNKMYKLTEILIGKYKKSDLNMPLAISGETYLTLALKTNDSNTINLLLSNFYIDTNQPNLQNEYPIEIAVKTNQIESLNNILRKEATSNFKLNGFNTLLYACEQDLTQISLKLIDFGYDINTQDNANNNRWTPLMHSIINNNETIALSLLSRKNLNINLRDEDGNTALHLAIQNENDYLVDKILKAGGDKQIRNNDNLNAIDMAKLSDDENLINLLKK
jgi:ankyrin repeat protein